MNDHSAFNFIYFCYEGTNDRKWKEWSKNNVGGVNLLPVTSRRKNVDVDRNASYHHSKPNSRTTYDPSFPDSWLAKRHSEPWSPGRSDCSYAGITNYLAMQGGCSLMWKFRRLNLGGHSSGNGSRPSTKVSKHADCHPYHPNIDWTC